MGNKIFMEKGDFLELKNPIHAKLNGWHYISKFNNFHLAFESSTENISSVIYLGEKENTYSAFGYFLCLVVFKTSSSRSGWIWKRCFRL